MPFPPSSQSAAKISRRRFVAGTGCLAAASFVSPQIARAAANDRMKVAFIGVGGRGGSNLRSITATGLVDVFAVCDVDTRFAEGAAQAHAGALVFQDFRKMYDAIGDQVDAVVVSTTEHTHAYATMPALQLGKHVYCEKPLAYNVYETRRITEAAKEAGVVTQMGTQIHATDNYHRVVELIQSGAIGDVREAHVWVSRAWGLQSEAEAEANKDRLFVDARPTDVMTPPEHMNWDLWLGPAPERPFHRVYFPGPNWYRWWDFANGTMSDLGSHWNDLPYWALELDAPQTVESFGIPPHPEIAPASMKSVYQYGARGGKPPVELAWYQGSYKPDVWTQGEIPQWDSGVLFVGDKGMLLSDYNKHLLLPEDQFVDFQRPEPFVPDSPGHHQEWVSACLGEGQTGSPFSYAGPLTEANHLGNVAYRVGQKIHWDAANMKCTGCPEADPLIRREPRAGWSL
ncbi:Inositol 2-dehydrogenase [Rubripirellula lacrimiformis]|uniref:Inositol 2-dehydrogenase n=1 Tax=Rubripirellula lacrimiformis TaxID=1930273 RepID=A0A517NED2_9BACT|nr:Gfo/Idh/MocA family oxidoreductase [Rubripirellula lacrimiformis]QDT05418.1 Inositol 2-dehydrogenase [Rubripirellula lacrimiformis]